MSDAMTQARKFFDSFGDDITWRVCNRELYERHLAALLTETRTKALEEAAAVAEASLGGYPSNDAGDAVDAAVRKIRSLKAEGGEI